MYQEFFFVKRKKKKENTKELCTKVVHFMYNKHYFYDNTASNMYLT